MQVIKAKTAGFCMGVSLAMRKLDKALCESPQGSLYTLGPIIHNPQVVKEYEAKGAACLGAQDTAPAGSTVVIRAHGLPQGTEATLRAHGLKVVNATCPKVKTAQIAIKRARSASMGTLLLFGEKDHPEVQGLISYADHDALIFNTLEELAALPLDKNRHYFVAAQTTQEKNIFEEVLRWLHEFFGREIPALRTICDATKNRQDDIIELAGKVKSMVIVGGMNSGNTRRLAEISASLGVFTVHCENAEGLPLDKLRELQPVGLSAGASTPDTHIKEVERVLIQS